MARSGGSSRATGPGHDPPAIGPGRTTGPPGRPAYRLQPVRHARGRLGARRRGPRSAHRRRVDGDAARGAGRRRRRGGGVVSRSRRGGSGGDGDPGRARCRGGADGSCHAQGAPRPPRAARHALRLGARDVHGGLLDPGAGRRRGRVPQARISYQPAVGGARRARERDGRRGMAPDGAASGEERVARAHVRGGGVAQPARLARGDPAGLGALDDGAGRSPRRAGPAARRGRRDVGRRAPGRVSGGSDSRCRRGPGGTRGRAGRARNRRVRCRGRGRRARRAGHRHRAARTRRRLHRDGSARPPGREPRAHPPVRRIVRAGRVPGAAAAAPQRGPPSRNVDRQGADRRRVEDALDRARACGDRLRAARFAGADAGEPAPAGGHARRLPRGPPPAALPRSSRASRRRWNPPTSSCGS